MSQTERPNLRVAKPDEYPRARQLIDELRKAGVTDPLELRQALTAIALCAPPAPGETQD